MIQKLLIGATLCLTLAACSDSKKNNNSEPKPLQAQDVTDTSMCYGKTPVNTNLYSNRWAKDFTFSNGAKVTQVLNFNYGRFTLTAYQEFKGRTGQLTVSSRATEPGANMVTFEDEDSDSNGVSAGGETFFYSLSIKNSTLSYSFSGPCLVFEIESQKVTYVPH